MNNLRPIWIHSDNYAWRDRKLTPQKGLFHCWAGTSERAYALIELSDGGVYTINQDDFRFLDNAMNINAFKNAWNKVEGKE